MRGVAGEKDDNVVDCEYISCKDEEVKYPEEVQMYVEYIEQLFHDSTKYFEVS